MPPGGVLKLPVIDCAVTCNMQSIMIISAQSTSQTLLYPGSHSSNLNYTMTFTRPMAHLSFHCLFLSLFVQVSLLGHSGNVGRQWSEAERHEGNECQWPGVNLSVRTAWCEEHSTITVVPDNATGQQYKQKLHHALKGVERINNSYMFIHKRNTLQKVLHKQYLG